MNPNTDTLYEQLKQTIDKAEKGRKIIGVLKIFTFGGALLFFIIMWGNAFLTYNQNAISMEKLLPAIFILFGVIIVGNFIFAKVYSSFAKQEKFVIKEIMTSLFPSIKLHNFPQGVTEKTLVSSHLFSGIKNATMPAQTFASMEMEVNNTKFLIADIGVNTNKTNRMTAGADSMFGLSTFYKGLIKPLLGTRLESAMFDFRGMFGWVTLKKEISSPVLIFPDHIEDKLGYLAHNLQALRKVEGNTLVKLEDVEFERNFAVYAKDEVVARTVLTPAMMVRMNELKQKFNRDIMFSFYKDRFYVAVSMPDGFLSLRGESLKNKNIIEEIYNDINISCEIINELHLK